MQQPRRSLPRPQESAGLPRRDARHPAAPGGGGRGRTHRQLGDDSLPRSTGEVGGLRRVQLGLDPDRPRRHFAGPELHRVGGPELGAHDHRERHAEVAALRRFRPDRQGDHARGHAVHGDRRVSHQGGIPEDAQRHRPRPAAGDPPHDDRVAAPERVPARDQRRGHAAAERLARRRHGRRHRAAPQPPRHQAGRAGTRSISSAKIASWTSSTSSSARSSSWD